jgi:hypothetical protein
MRQTKTVKTITCDLCGQGMVDDILGNTHYYECEINSIPCDLCERDAIFMGYAIPFLNKLLSLELTFKEKAIVRP